MASQSPREMSVDSLVDNMTAILRRWDEGETFDITCEGRVVARLGHRANRRTWVAGSALERILDEAPPDENFKRDVDDVLGGTIDEWFDGRGKRLFGPFEPESQR